MKTTVLAKTFIILALFFVGGIGFAPATVPGASAQTRLIRVGIFNNYPIAYESDSLVTGFHFEL